MSILTALIAPVTDLISEFIPDTDKRDEIAFKLSTLAENHAHQEVLAQQKINEESAKHPSIFVAGARPATLWICNLGLAYSVVLYPIMDVWLDMPVLDTGILVTMLGGLLGMGGMRMNEKVKGVARNNIGK